MAGPAARGGPPRAGRPTPWRALLLAWLSLGTGTAQGPRRGAVRGGAAAVPRVPAPLLPLRRQACAGRPGRVPLGAVPRSAQRLRPQLPGRGAQLLLHLRTGAGRHPLQPRLPGPLRRRALPERRLRRDPGLGRPAQRLRPVRRRPRRVPLRAPALPGRAPLLRLFRLQERDQDPGRGHQHQALMTSDRRYVVNGDWSIAWPGAYEAAGTRVLYARAADGTESLEAPGPTAEDLYVLVLLQEPNPGIEYEFWVPRPHATSPLRQPQPRGAGSPQPTPAPAPPPLPLPQGAATETPRRNPASHGGTHAGRCGRCRTPKGRSQRIRHFCQSDFVFQARILAVHTVGQETRYEVQVKTPYRHRFPLVSREYVWVSNTCGCPRLLPGRQYLLMARRHVNHEHTLNRILLQDDSYARPWSPREDRLVRDAARRCAQPP
ncbi:ADAMTS-like protein 5 isoform X5 [Rhea pennata]|uniref:ADAMTS-like protein 5 isoform X5 n=1 Tax=Rhea pennata TaxID=8795 RepID=UPI002E26C656